jgi:hypothetical protein
MMHIARSIPYFEALLKSGSRRWDLLDKFPSFVKSDFIEILHNIVVGNVKIGHYKKSLKKHQDTLLKMFNAKQLKRKLYILDKRFSPSKKSKKKKYFGANMLHEIKNYQDGDGFVWAALIPFFQWLASLIGPAVASGAIAYGTKRTFEAIENAVTKKDKT